MTTFFSPSLLDQWLTQHPIPALFLDIDGTLAPFEVDPADSKIPNKTLTLLKKLPCRGVPIAIITGRSLVEARHMLSPLMLPIGATHGLEIAFEPTSQPTIPAFIHAELPLIIKQIEHQCQPEHSTNFLLEKKPYSVALHYRQYPHLAQTAEKLMQYTAQQFPKWQLKAGKFVWEILPKGVNKGHAVTKILEYFSQIQPKTLPWSPIFIGDDVSDEAGFLSVQACNGIGIKVGEPIDDTHAHFFVRDIDEVTRILQHIYQYYSAPLTSTTLFRQSESTL